MSSDFWEDPERVERFAEREPDHRLARLVEDYSDPASVRVLDVGCAGGRNTIFLAERGFDVHALDASRAMVARTRRELGKVLSSDADDRVLHGRMDDLSAWPARHFGLVVSLGVLHSASRLEEWDRAAAETARVLKPGGLLLFNQFTPAVDLTGQGVTPVPGEPGVYDGFPAGRAVLLTAHELDSRWAAHGRLEPAVASETVSVELDPGRRVSVNALYRRGET